MVQVTARQSTFPDSKLQPPKDKVFVLGETGVEQELESENVRYIGGTDKSLQREMAPDDYINIANDSALDDDVGVVLTGLDFHPSYLKYSLGMAYLCRGATFLATNIDSTLPKCWLALPRSWLNERSSCESYWKRAAGSRKAKSGHDGCY